MRLSTQGSIFFLLSVLLIALHMRMPALDQTVERLILIGLIVLLGIPHGALDITLAKSLYNIQYPRQWIAFVCLYLLLAASVFFIWWIAPTLFLSAFLLISAIHFATDPERGTSRVFCFAYGASIIVLPALRHYPEMVDLLGFVAGTDAGQLVAALLHALSIPWLVLALLLVALNIRKNIHASLEYLAVIAIAVFLPPLYAFTLFFCAMHSPRHLMRAYRFAKLTSFAQLLKMTALPMFFVCIAFLVALLFLDGHKIDEYFIQVLFVMLAALTVPHMVIIERFRHV